MRNQITFFVTILALVLMTWIMTKFKKINLRDIKLSNPKKEALLSLIPIGFVMAAANIIVSNASLKGKWIFFNFRPGITGIFLESLLLFGSGLISIIPFIVMMVIRKQGLKTVGISKQNLLPALIIGLTTIAIGIFCSNLFYKGHWIKHDFLFFFFAQNLGVGLSEEMIFRGYLQTRFSAWLPRYGWLVPVILFVLWHIPQTLIYGVSSIPRFAARQCLLLVVALSFGWSMKRTGNIVGLSFIHAVVNVNMVMK